MLPAELLLQVCDHLSPTDVISLSETCTSNKAILSNLRTTFLHYPWYNRKFSSKKTGSWGGCKVTSPPSKAFETVQFLPSYFEDDLPGDFQALRGDCRRDEKYNWNICDQGIYFNTIADSDEEDWYADDSERDGNNGIVDLREYWGELPATPYPARILPRIDSDEVDGKRYRIDADENEHVAAEIVFLVDNTHLLLVKYGTGKMQQFDLGWMRSYSLYLIGDMVIVSPGEVNHETKYLLPGRPDLATLEDVPTDTEGYEGWMMYNGNLFKAVLDEDFQLVVAPAATEMEMHEKPPRLYNIYQDERHPRYAMAYTMKEGIMTHVIDLEKRQVSMVLDRDSFWIAGLSQGELGLWKFSPTWLYDSCSGQEKNILGELVDVFIFHAIDQHLSYNDIYETDADVMLDALLEAHQQLRDEGVM